MKYQKRHIVVSAVQWNGGNLTEVTKFLAANGQRFFQQGALLLMNTGRGDITAGIKDWFVSDHGDFSVEHDDDFHQKYEVVKEEKTSGEKTKQKA